ncbi:MAG: serine/threonine-protein kinase [Vulcanimicrobiota bacterium]
MRTLLLLLLLSLPCLGQSWQVTIQTEPAGAEVLKNNQPLGVSGQPFSLTAASHRPQQPLHLVVRLPGYKDAQVDIPGQTFEQRGGGVRYPDVPVPLTPSNALIPLLRKPWWLALMLAGLGAAGWWWAKTRRRVAALAARDSKLSHFEATIPKHDLLGSVMGGYRILDKLGEGGMAMVFRAVPDQNLDEGEAVALKVMLPEMYGKAEHRDRFIREGQVSRDLSHPNIVRLYRLDTHGDYVYLALELIHGKTLSTRLRAGGLPLMEGWLYLEQIFDGLVYAHGKGIVHRDLKPGNIMVTDDNKVKVMDFGLARRREVDKTITVTGVVLGTPGYMAPEQISEAVDPRSDQYAIGVIAYELLAGQRPFESEDPMKMIMAALTGPAPDPRTFRPDLAEPIAQVMAKLVSRQPDDRYPSMAEAREAFRQAVKAC